MGLPLEFGLLTSNQCVTPAVATCPTGTATAIAASQPAVVGVLIVADASNGGVAYIGGAGVTTSTGLDLSAGDSIFLRIADPSLIYCIGSIASQVLRIVVL